MTFFDIGDRGGGCGEDGDFGICDNGGRLIACCGHCGERSTLVLVWNINQRQGSSQHAFEKLWEATW